MRKSYTLCGTGGIASFAISAIDIALWDIRCRKKGEPLWRVAGGASSRCRAYAGGIDLLFSLDQLRESVEGYLGEGFDAVKIKVGRESLEEDVERARAIRELIGAERTFMVDANYSMTVEKAIEAANRFEECDILWFEEPTLPDDYVGYAKIADATGVPLAMGRTSIRYTNSATLFGNRSYLTFSRTHLTVSVSRVG